MRIGRRLPIRGFNPWLLCVISVFATFSTFSTYASESSAHDEVVAQLVAEVKALTARLASVEGELREQQTGIKTETYGAPIAVAPSAPAKASWTDSIKLKGDFRYRHEAFDVDDRRDRHRQRMRARVLVTGQVSDTITSGFGLATGDHSPVSTNQSFDDGFSSKNVVIDLAYINWQSPIDGLAIRAGKFKNPLHRAGGNGLIWDGDLNPEGVGLTFERGAIFANALASWVDESSSDDDSFLVGGQFGVQQNISDNGKITAGLGYYNYLDSEGEPAFFDGSAQGNQLNADGEYISGFELVEGFVEYKTKINQTELTLFADYVQNLDADDFDQGYAVGAKVKNGKWQARYTYQELEADAVLGTFTDSDFIGGGTDGEGHIISADYALSKRVGLRGTLFLNDRNIDFGNEEDFTRLMLDINFKY